MQNIRDSRAELQRQGALLGAGNSSEVLRAITLKGTEYSSEIGPRVFVPVTTDKNTAINFASFREGPGVVYWSYVRNQHLFKTPVQSSTESEKFIFMGFKAAGMAIVD